MGRRHHLKKKRRATVAALAVCFVLLALLIGGAIARYQRRFDSDGVIRAKEFYFTSDFLDGETHTLAPGTTAVTFTLGNHADELRFSEVDIAYTVTVTNGATVTTGADGTLEKDVKKDAEVTISGLQPGEKYLVTATGTGGYTETLTAIIEVLAEEAKLYYHQENVPGEYLLLTVWNEGDEPGDVTIRYDGIPDNTNPNMADWVTGSVEVPQTKSVHLEPYESKVFRFFTGTVTVADATPKKLS